MRHAYGGPGIFDQGLRYSCGASNGVRRQEPDRRLAEEKILGVRRQYYSIDLNEASIKIMIATKKRCFGRCNF